MNAVKVTSENRTRLMEEDSMKNNTKNSCENTPRNTRQKRLKPNKDFVEPNRPSSIRKPLKRIRSPGPEDSSPGE